MREKRSIGIDLQPWVDTRLLQFEAERPSRSGLEAHLASMYQNVRDFQPSVAIIDAVTNLLAVGSQTDVRAMLMRMIDHLKVSEITGLFSSLTSATSSFEETEAGISSLMDTWIVMGIDELEHERRRSLRILKSRGMPHSNRVHEFALTNHGLRLTDGRG